MSEKDPQELRNLVIESLAETGEEFAKPIDFEDLERRGILTKAGAWYRVNDIQQLPSQVQRRISAMAFDPKTRATKIKISKTRLSSKQVEKLRKLARKFGIVTEHVDKA